MRMCYVDGFIVFARNLKIHFFDIDSRVSQLTASQPVSMPTVNQLGELNAPESDTRRIRISERELLSLTVKPDNKFKCFLDVGLLDTHQDQEEKQRIIMLLERDGKPAAL